MKNLASVFLFLFCFAPAIAGTPMNVFQPYVGEWEGKYFVYSPEGEPVKRIHVRHKYRMVDSKTLEGSQIITYEDGSVEHVQAKDTLEGDRLFCKIVSDKFGEKLLEGRAERDTIFWWRREKDLLEVYRERVIDGGKTYAIDGYGIYGKNVYTFFAEYTKVK